MSLKYGRRPARITMAGMYRSHALVKHLVALGTPPPASPDWVTPVMNQSTLGWGMAENDTYGCCVIADCKHTEMLRTANVGTIWSPTDQQVMSLYAYFQGMQIDPNDPNLDANTVQAYLANNDNGCNESTVIDYLTKTGWNGHKLDGAANLNPADINQIKWAVNIFGASRLGVNLPDSAMNQFTTGQPWDYVSTANLDGGHDVPVVKYDADGTVWVVTWGKLQPVTPAFMAGKYSDGTPYVEEAHAELALDWVNTTGTSPNNFNLNQLLDELNAITTAFK